MSCRWLRWKTLARTCEGEDENSSATLRGKNQTVTAGLSSPGLQKGYENGADQRQHGEGWKREKGKKTDGRTGVRYKSQRLTELVGEIVSRPYVSHGTKRIGEGECSLSLDAKFYTFTYAYVCVWLVKSLRNKRCTQKFIHFVYT